MTTRIQAISVSHQTATIDMRELLSVSDNCAEVIVQSLARRFGEAVLLRTCGRLELYVTAIGGQSAIGPFARALGRSRRTLESVARPMDEAQASRHLMEVASGMRSPLPGEHHVLGQVRSAGLDASNAGTSGPLLTTLFQSAIHCGRRVRNETPIGRLASSYADAALHALRRRLSPGIRVLLVGSGTLANEIGSGIAAERVANLTIASRHRARGIELANRTNATWRPVREIAQSIRQADVVICCTSSRSTLIDARDIPVDDKHRTIVDLGMPRNVDARVGSLPNVTLIDLDLLTNGIAIARDCIDEARMIIDGEAARFMAWLERRREFHATGRISYQAISTIRDEVAA